MDNLIFCSDLEALKTKLKEDGHFDEESGTYTVNHTLTPLKYKGILSISYCRNFALDLADYPMLKDLGDYDEMFADTAKHDLYKSVYDYTTPVEYVDENGDAQTYQQSKYIGRFA